MDSGKWSNELKSWFHFIFNSTYFYLNADCKRFFAFFLSFFLFLHFTVRAKISAITVATGAWLKRKSRRGRRGERRGERQRETQHGAAQQQLHFQYFYRHPNEEHLLLSRDASYLSLWIPPSRTLSLSLSFSRFVSLQRHHHFLLLPLPPFVQILVLYIYKFLTTSSLECNYFPIFFLPLPYTRSQFPSVCVCVCVLNAKIAYFNIEVWKVRLVSPCLVSSHFFSFR